MACRPMNPTVRMPSRSSSLIRFIVDIKNAVLASEATLREIGIELSDFIKGNEKARERMKAQYSIAGMKKVWWWALTMRQKP